MHKVTKKYCRVDKGQLKVSQVSSGTDVYSIKGDFELSNGYTFSVDWEGAVSMKREG